MSYFTKEEIALIAKSFSPFYKELYSDIDVLRSDFSALPIATSSEIKRIAKDDHTKFIALPTAGGIYYTSSGTTAIAKLTKFDKEEWNDLTNLIAVTHWKHGFLCNNDIVANLSFPGHASFMLVHDVVRQFPGSITEISVGADQEFSVIADLIVKLKATVLTGVYSSFIAFADWMVKWGLTNPRIHILLGGGEILYGSQLELLNIAFPNAIVRGFVYGSTDSSLIGYNIKDHPETVHEIYDSATHFEILDPETLQPILKEGIDGLVVVTNLMRTNAPVVRYSNGDIARWLPDQSKSGKKFELVGRQYPPIQIYDQTVSGNGILTLINRLKGKMPLIRIESSLSCSNTLPIFDIQFAVSNSSVQLEKYEDLVLDELIGVYPFLHEMNFTNKIQLQAKAKNLSDFSVLSRKRGKLIVDQRS